MITLPDDKILRVMSIDTGSNTLGSAITDVNIDDETKQVRDCETIEAAKSIWRYQNTADMRGDKWARMRVLRRFMREKLEQYRPDVVAIESPFMFKRPEAFAVLREVIVYLIQAIEDYDPNIEIIMVPPTKAKLAVGANEYVGKDPVRDAVLTLNDVYYDAGLDPREFDEHEIDSIAIMYYIANDYIDHLKGRRALKNAPTRRTKGGRRKRARKVPLGA